MYRRQYRILVLDDDPVGLYQAKSALGERDYFVAGVSNIEQARAWLAQCPIDLLIVALRLRGTNGLQFFVEARTRQPELAGILVGIDGDQSFATDVWRYGATLIIRPLDPARFLMIVAETLASIRRRQRWPRKVVGREVAVKIGRTTGRLVDASYGGVRFAFEGESYDLPSPMTLEFPSAQLAVRAELVWSSRADDGVSSVCGAGLLDDAEEWRRFVDTLP